MKTYKTSREDEVLLDDKDYEYLIVKCGYSYCTVRNKKGKILNIQRMIPALLSNTGKRKLQYIHWDVIGHPDKEMVTDHIDGNPLNNQKNNLRHCSYRENGGNLRYLNASKIYSSKYTGVSLDKNAQKWMAYISINKNKKRKYLGLFITEEDAAQAYKEAYKKL